MTSKSFLHIVCVMLITFQLSASALAQQAPSDSSNLDLGSGNRTVTAGSGNHNFTSATITVGGSSVTVNAGSLITPAESVALNQVLGGGTQSLVLDAAGRAVGGQFLLTGNNLSQVVIPTGVTAVRDFGTAGAITISGALNNAGSLFAVSSNSQFNTALISAGNIFNGQGALLTSILPSSGFQSLGLGGLLSSVNLALNSSQNIVNYGAITSSGNLNLTAAGAIINALPTGVTGPSPIMQAVGDISMITNSVQNAGLIASLNANINVATMIAQNLAINNMGGTFQALNGTINIRDQFFNGKFDTTLLGGDFASKSLNIFSGDGIINMDVNSVAGQLNLVGGSAHVSAQAGDLHIGALSMSGDPTIASGGDVFLEMSQFGGNWVFPGNEALVITAGKNIINVDVTALSTSGKSGTTGNIVMQAGGMIDLQSVPVTSISTDSNGGNSGSITLTAGGPILLGTTNISTRSVGGQAGAISIKSTNANISATGLLSLDSSSQSNSGGDISINAKTGINAAGGININSSSDNGFAGSVNIISEAGNVVLGSKTGGPTDINASSIMGAGGQIFIQTLNGSVFAGNGTIDASSKQNGGGGFSIFAEGGSVNFAQSKIDVSGVNGGYISVLTLSGAADINMANVDLKANGAGAGVGGTVSISSGLNGATSVSSDNVSLGNIEITGGDDSFASISVSSSKNDIQIASITSNGASVNLNSGSNVRVNSISDDNPAGLGAYIVVNANNNAASTDVSSTLLVNQMGGNNYIGSTNANSAGGGGLFISNHGLGGIQVGSVSLNASVGDAGIISLTADGDINLSGTSYSANGGVNGAGGQIIISSGSKITGGDVNFSATAGKGFSGGSLSINAANLQFGNLTADTSGHGSGSAGSVGIGANVINASSINITNDGGGASTVQIAGSVQVDSLNVLARGGDDPGKNGGNIMIVFNDGVHGSVNLDASGAVNGSGGDITLSSLTDLDLSTSASKITSRGGSNAGNGGFLFLNANGKMSIDSSKLDVSPQAANGNGGSMYITTGLDSNSASAALSIAGTLSADGAGVGNGGTIQITTLNTKSQSDFTVSNNGSFTLSARSGSAGGSGGSINLSAGGDLNVDGAAISVAARGVDGNGGNLSFTAGAVASGQVGAGNNTLTVSGDLSTASAGKGDGGQISMRGPQINIIDGTTISAAASGSGNGGSVTVATAASGANLTLGQGSTISARSTGGHGGSVSLSSGANLSLTGSLIDAGSSGGAGGSVTLAAGNSGVGALSIDADVVADGGGSSNGGTLNFSQNSSTAVQLGGTSIPGGSGFISAGAAGSGNGGSLTISNGANNSLNVSVNGTVSLAGASDDHLGTINASSSSSVNISGQGTLKGSLSGSGSSYTAKVSGAGTVIGVGSVSSTNGDVQIQASASDGEVAFANNSSLTASKGAIEIGAPRVSFLGNSTISMDSVGLMKIDSGNASSSLTLDFASGSQVNFDISQGNAVRPGNILIGPSNGSTTLSTAGSGSKVDFNSATVSITSANGGVSIGQGLDLSSNAFDDTSNVGMEIISSNGDINLNGAISARQVDVTALSSGNINIGNGDINSPTVNLTVQGNSSINQVGNGTIGIGTLSVQAGTGNIGSALKAIETNVLEIRANGGGSAFINNASTVDLRTSAVAGTFQLNNKGDVSIESTVSAGNLGINADGSISVFSNVNGSNGATLATGTGAQLTVSTGADLSSSNGSVSISTENLVLDGRILTQSKGASVDISSDSSLALSGSSGTILAGAAVSFSAPDSVSFNSNYNVNAGSTGVVQVATAPSGSGVNIMNGLTVGGGSQLAISTNALNIGSGAITLSKTSGTAMTVASNGGALNVNVSSSANIASQGGSVEFHAQTASPLNFNRVGAGIAQLNVSGGQLVTESAAADTNLNNVDLVTNGNVQVNVHGGNLNLNGNIYSSMQGGVIVLQDPNGLTITGSGTVGFTSGKSGSIFVQSFGAGNNLTFAGNSTFNAGTAGNVNFLSQSQIIFASGASSTIIGSLNISAPTLVFGAQSAITDNSSAAITVSSSNGAPVNIVTPSGSSATLSSAGGTININGAGANINFTSSGASAGTLNFRGANATISTSNATVTLDQGVVINSDHDVNVLTPGGNFVNNGQLQTPTGTTTIEAAGNLYIDKNVSANSLIIQTTAKNGNITLGANVDVVNNLLVSANGSGNITQTAGKLTAASITLRSGSGNIGTADRAIQVSTPSLSVSTTGSANISDSRSVRVESFSVGKGLTLTASGNIDIGPANASSISIGSSGVFKAVNGSVNINAINSISFANGVTLKAQGSALNMSAGSISLGEGARVKTRESTNFIVNANTISMGENASMASAKTLTINSAMSGQDYKLTAKGNLTVNGNMSGKNISLATSNDGNISFGGNVNAKNLTANADGNGDIIQTSGTLSASSSMVLSSDHGDIGNSKAALRVNTPTLQVETGRSGLVNISASGDLVLLDSSSGGNFTVSTQGNLSANDVSTRNGSITLSAGNSVSIAKDASLIANEGNLTIQSRNTDSGTITIGKNVDLEAFSARSDSGRGNIYVVIGAVPSTPVAGKAPSGVSVSERWGGHVYFGKNGITANGNNEIRAWGSNVVFNTGNRPKSAIVLEGKVFMLADPPPVEMAMTEPAGFNVPQVAAITNIQLPTTSLNFVPGTDITRRISMDSMHSLKSSDPGLGLAVLDKEEAETQKPEKQELQAVACITPILSETSPAESNNKIHRVSLECFEKTSTGSCKIYTAAADYEHKDGVIAFNKGEMLIDAHKKTQINSKYGQLEIAPGAHALLRSNDRGMEVFNIYEGHWGAVKVKVGSRDFVIGVGQCLHVGKDSKIAIRNEKEHKVESQSVKTAEFSILSLISNSDVLGKVMKSKAKDDREMSSRLFKIAACLAIVTQAHGLYKTGN